MRRHGEAHRETYVVWISRLGIPGSACDALGLVAAGRVLTPGEAAPDDCSSGCSNAAWRIATEADDVVRPCGPTVPRSFGGLDQVRFAWRR